MVHCNLLWTKSSWLEMGRSRFKVQWDCWLAVLLFMGIHASGDSEPPQRNFFGQDGLWLVFGFFVFVWTFYLCLKFSNFSSINIYQVSSICQEITIHYPFWSLHNYKKYLHVGCWRKANRDPRSYSWYMAELWQIEYGFRRYRSLVLLCPMCNIMNLLSWYHVSKWRLNVLNAVMRWTLILVFI